MKHISYNAKLVNGRRRHDVILCEDYGKYKFAIVDRGSYPCAYIRIPTELIGKVIEDAADDVEDVKCYCHGGVTYAGVKPEESLPNGYWIGWDYAHYNDYCATEYGDIFPSHGHKWTTEEIYQECIEALLSLKENYEKD